MTTTTMTAPRVPTQVPETVLALRHLCHSLLPADLAAASVTPIAPDRLSRRQWVVLEMLANGLTDDRIAHNLDVCERTVRAEIGALRDGFGASSRFQLGMRFAELVSESARWAPWSCPLGRATGGVSRPRSG